MKQSVARKWIKALESGKYRQVKGKLKGKLEGKKCGYCCLGVLCNLYAEETGKGKFKVGLSGSDRPFILANGVTESGALPQDVMDWAGIKYSGGKLQNSLEIKKDDGTVLYGHSLIDLNDNLGFNFREIAKVLRKNFKTL